MNPQIMPSNITQFMPVFNKVSDSLISVLEDVKEPDGMVKDIHKYLVCWTVEGYYNYFKG